MNIPAGIPFSPFQKLMVSFILFIGMTSHIQAATFTVTNLNNSGIGSLRQAITSANGAPGADNIVFTVDGVINITFALPGINQPLVIDGRTSPSYSCGQPSVAIDGGGGSNNGLQFLPGAAGSAVYGLNVRNFQFNGIQFITTPNITVQSCFIGTDLTGTVDMGNGQNGLQIEIGADNAQIGGTNSCQRNIISGNTGVAITLNQSDNCVVTGNYMGTDVSGLNALGNDFAGMLIVNGSVADRIGGPSQAERNIISGNGAGTTGNAIEIAFGSNHVIQGNNNSGINIENSNGNTIGGNTSGHRNVLSASVNEYGVFLDNADNNTILGNYMGTDLNGLNPLPNFGGGVRIDTGSVSNIVGGTAAGEGNVIAHNLGFGVGVFQPTDIQNLISGNSMFCNLGPGIDLNGAGNANHPAPVIVGAGPGGANGTADPLNIIELFYDSLCTATCQGRTYIGSTTADGTGNWSYVGPLVNGATLVATATDVAPPAASANNTSEFSCFVILPVEGLEFTAQRSQLHTVHLNWLTSYESNNAFWAVERSFDGIHFQEIGQVAGQGDDPDGATYAFTDPNAPEAQLHYRLRQVDFDGTSAYSAVLTLQAATGEPELLLYDHPVKSELKFSLAYVPAGQGSCILLDGQGRKVLELDFAHEPNRAFSFPVSSLASGPYFLQIITGQHRFFERIWVAGDQ